MDGIHDLGGKEGFGAVDVGETEEPFHAPWEGRAWAITQSTRAPEWTIDWWRHVRERIDPVDYVTRPYFDQWLQTEIAAHIDAGTFTLPELATGRAAGEGGKARLLTREEAVAADARHAVRYDREIDAPAAFAPGDRVRAAALGTPHHTRLPGYARGKAGTVHAHHGAHLFPDAGARGKEEAQHLYTVAFAAAALWPEAGERRDRVFIDLWESYLAPAA